MIAYRRADIEQDLETILTFRKDTVESLPNHTGVFHEEDYLKRLKKRIHEYPEGQMLLVEEGKTIGALFLSIQQEEDRKVGYIHFLYVVPEVRGRGYAKGIMERAEEFFLSANIKEYHLRVGLENIRAIRLYEKTGLEKLRKEANGMGAPSWRMGKVLL